MADYYPPVPHRLSSQTVEHIMFECLDHEEPFESRNTFLAIASGLPLLGLDIVGVERKYIWSGYQWDFRCLLPETHPLYDDGLFPSSKWRIWGHHLSFEPYVIYNADPFGTLTNISRAGVDMYEPGVIADRVCLSTFGPSEVLSAMSSFLRAVSMPKNTCELWKVLDNIGLDPHWCHNAVNATR